VPYAWYIGRPGGMRQLVPAPRRDYTRTADLGVATYQLAGGGAAVDRAASSVRTFGYSWQWLDPAAWSVLTALADGQYGPGPYTLLDAATGNFLTPNQASAGAKVRSADGFAVGGGETLGVVSSPVDVGDRAVAWTVPASPTSGVLRLVAPTPTVRSYLATPAGVVWCCWARLRATNAVTARMVLSWRDATGTQVSTSQPSTWTALSTSTWGRFPAIGTAPPGAVYLEPQITVNPASVSAPTTVYVGSARLLVGGDDDLWLPGEGLPLVAVTSLSEQVRSRPSAPRA
jgi:hypothetical protein